MTSRGRGVSITVFLADGTPDGLRIVEKSNWTGLLLVSSRSDLAALRARPEVQGPGVYLLLGPDDESGQPPLYVGEADDVGKRLGDHVRKDDDYWTWVVVLTAKDRNFNKASARWLEARLIDKARRAGRSSLRNGNAGAPVRLSERDTADIESYMDDALMILPVLAVAAFQEPVAPPMESARVRLHLTGPNTSAQGYDGPGGFLVLDGARGRVAEVPSIHPYMTAARKRLLEQGVLVQRDGGLVLTRNHVFSSPSLAAAALLGRNANGRVEWKDEAGRTLKNIQESALI